MKTTRKMIQELRVGNQIMVGYAYCAIRKCYVAHLFGKKTTAKERVAYGYATGTISKIEKPYGVYRPNKSLWLTIDGVPDRQEFYEWQKATVVHSE